MSDEGAENGASAGISHQAVDVAEVFERLKREVRRAGAQPADDTAPADDEPAARAEAERVWRVALDVPIVRRPGPRGRVAYAGKRVMRKLMRWYVGPVVADQRSFNRAALRLLDELDERLHRLERPKVDVCERQRRFVGDFAEAAPVLHLGSGRGELLAMLREAGVEARGVEADPDLVIHARGEGLDVEQADSFAHLESLAESSLGGIFAAARVVQQPPGPALVRLLELAAQKLRPGGVLVVEAIDSVSPDGLASLCGEAGLHVERRPGALDDALVARRT